VNRIGQLESFKRAIRVIFGPLRSKTLDFRTPRKRDSLLPCELVEHVADANVKGLAEDTISSIEAGDDLCITSARIQKNRVITTTALSPDLDMSHAMVDTDQRHT